MSVSELSHTGEWVWVPFDVDKRFDGYRIDRFLSQRLVAYSRSRIQKMLTDARVTRRRQLLKPSAKVHGGDQILIAYPRREEAPYAEDVSLPIVYEDDVLVIVNKPANLLSHPTDKIQRHTVLALLRHLRLDISALHLLHRLDRETSGVLALAKNPVAARAWTEAMESRKMKKEYLALVQGVPKPKGVIDAPIGRQEGKIKVRQWVHVPDAVPAVTRFERVKSFTQPDGQVCSLVRAYPETGRLHQIRVHLASQGHPLLGDVLYNGEGELYLKMAEGGSIATERKRLGFGRLALHAERLTFPHPSTGRSIQVSAPLPSDLAAFLDTLCPL